MRIAVIGDPHGNLKKVKRIPLKDVDLIFSIGDVGKADLARRFAFDNVKRQKKGLEKLEPTKKQLRDMHMEIHDSTMNILKYLSRYAPVYTLEGNVSIPTLSSVKKDERKYGIKLPCTREELAKIRDVHIVKNVVRNFNGLRVGFLEYFLDTDWVKTFTPGFKDRIKRARKETPKARRILRRFGDLDILVCHQPPYGVLDKVTWKKAPKHWIGKYAGSKVILGYIKKKQPRRVFCGHIHEGEGKKKIGKTEVYNLGVASHKIINIE
jgi:Icc-related predicted phosphoesterase